MTIPDRLFGRWTRRAVAAIVVLQLSLIISGTARAKTEPIAAMVPRVSPAVVTVISVRPQQPEDDKPGAKVVRMKVTGRSTAIGSGFIIDPSGFIATNRHVIDGATAVIVMTADGVRYPAAFAGMADKADIALLRIDTGHTLPFLVFGDSDKMRVDDKVIAIGSPFGFDTSVTAGIISAVNRDIVESPFDDYIQTDAPINHGNSGGPLFNLAGKVIGMNSVLFAPGPGSAGVGFAVPSNDLKFIYDRLIKTGEIRAGMLPIQTQQVRWMLEQAFGTGDLLGALVTSVNDDSGMMLRGKIHPGDVIRSFDGQPVLDPRDLARKAARAPIGGDVALEICRDGTSETVQVRIRAWPEAAPLVFNNDGPRTLGLELAAGRRASGQPIVRVASVDPNGKAADSRIQKDDIILEVQQTPVSEPDQALSIFRARSALKHHYAAVLVERDGRRTWIGLAIPD